MSPKPSPGPLGRDDFAALVTAVAEAVAAKIAAPVPQTFDQVGAMQYVGLSRSGWFRAKSADLLPKPIHIAGSGERWRRKDLDNWLERQKPRRK